MMEDFSGLALPPLFGEHILEAELEPGGVELVPGEVMSMITVMWMSVNGIANALIIALYSVFVVIVQSHLLVVLITDLGSVLSLCLMNEATVTSVLKDLVLNMP